MAENLNTLKKQMFHGLLNLAGRVFVLVRYSADVVIGKRGFLPEEKEKGLVLVFNNKMNFEWDEAGISARLVFGAATEQCFIPQDNIISIFSPELLAQFTVSPEEKLKLVDAARISQGKKPVKTEAQKKVVKVDFTRKR